MPILVRDFHTNILRYFVEKKSQSEIELKYNKGIHVFGLTKENYIIRLHKMVRI